MAETSGKLPLSAQEERVQFLFKRLYHPDPDVDIPWLLFGNLAEMLREDQSAGNRTAEHSGPSKALVHDVAMLALEPGLEKNSLSWTNLSDLATAYTLLLAAGIEDERKDKRWIQTHAVVCYALERYPEAQSAFDKLSAQDLGNFAILRETAARVQSVPLFRNNFGTRLSMAWDAFQGPAMDLLNAWKRAPASRIFFPLSKELTQIFLDYLDLDTYLYLTPLSRKPTFCFSSPNLDLDIFVINYAFHIFSDDIKSIWDFTVGRPHRHPDEFKEPFMGIRLETVRLCAADSPNHTGANVQIFHDILTALHRKPSTRIAAQYLARTLTTLVLGELEAAVNLNSITILEALPSPSASFSLLDLPQRLQQLGYIKCVTPRDLQEKLLRNYTRTPSPAGPTVSLLRQDIVSGWTRCQRLQDDYDSQQKDAFFHYLNMGVCACFIAWPNSIMPGSADEFKKMLTDHLDRTEAYDVYQIIGEAEGTENHYLDFLVFVPPMFARALESFFRSIPGGDRALMQAFCFSSSPDKLSSFYPHHSKPERKESSAARSSDTASSSSKKKSKSKGKRKR